MSGRKGFMWIDTDGKGSLAEQMDRVIHDNEYINQMNAEAAKGNPNANLSFLNTVKVVEAEKLSDTTARIVYRIPVMKEYLNPSMTLHGGQQAAFYDIGTSWLLYLVRRPGFWINAGTSRSLTVTYLRPAIVGDIVLMECEIVNLGKRMCLLHATMKKEKDGSLVSTCEHTKFNVDADKEKL